MSSPQDAASASRSPSPAPQPPIAATPGPRATQLQRLYDDAVAHVLKTCSYAHFSACFPTPAARVPAAMAQLHAQFTEKLGAGLRREFAGLIEERGVISGLNALDSLIDEARRSKRLAEESGISRPPTPPHTLPASQLYAAHVAPLLAGPMQEMRVRQAALETDNVNRLQRVQQQRREIERLVRGLEEAAADLDGSIAELQRTSSLGTDADALLRDEARAAEVEMMGARG